VSVSTDAATETTTTTIDLTATVPDLDPVCRLVPTERQRAQGVELEVDETALRVADTDVTRLSIGRRVLNYLDSINPLAIEGSKLPMVLCSLIGFITGWQVASVFVMAPEIQADFGLSLVGYAKVGSYIATMLLIVGIPMGYLIDKMSRVQLIRATTATGAVSAGVQGIAPNFGTLMAGRFGLGLGLGPEAAVTLPYLADSYPSHVRARVFASFAFFTTFGTVVAQPIVGLVTRDFGWRVATLIQVLLCLTAFVLALFAKEPVRGAQDRRELGVREELVNVVEETPRMGEALKGAWGIKSLRLLSIATFILGFTSLIESIDANVYASQFGLDPLQRSFLGTVQSIITLPFVAMGAGVADRLLQRRPSSLVSVQASFCFLAAGCYALKSVAGNVWVFYALSTIPFVLLALLTPAQQTLKSLVVPSRYRGIGQQIGSPFTLAAVLIGPQLLAVVPTGEGVQKAFLYLAPFSVVAGFVFLSAGNCVANDIRAAKAAALARQESEASRRERQNKILVCRDIDVAIDEVQILFRIDLDIREGEVVALVGTNGAGKSTLLRAICGLQQASNGAIFFDGRDITYLSTHENAQLGIVYMPGGQGVFPLMTVRDNLTTAAAMNARGSKSDMKAELEKVLDFFPRLRERLDVQAGTMSGGEQQMLALSQAFLMKPRLLMIDELSLGLAPAVVEQLLDAIRGMRDEGITVLLVEQSLNVALNVADRAVFMNKGEVAFDGPTEALLARPDLVRSVFMGGAVSGGSARVVRHRPQADEGSERFLQCEGLSISYGGLQVLDDVSVHVGAGEVVGIIGPNGAGKTTLFDLLSGYARPDRGTVRLDDTDITRLSPDARARLGLGRAFQNARLFPPLTVRENIAVALERRASRSPLLGALWAPSVRKSERKLYTRVDGFIELLGLEAYADKFVRELSTGTRRAVEVACQMAAEPKVLLLDEPSSGLAQAETEALGPALLRIVRETGCGMLVIEHDLPLITGISDRLVAMELGRVVTSVTPQDFPTDPRVLASYLAASADVIERSGSRVGSVLAAVAHGMADDSRQPAQTGS
jgi:branched-chain amino acid transport system ATP-binding protein